MRRALIGGFAGERPLRIPHLEGETGLIVRLASHRLQANSAVFRQTVGRRRARNAEFRFGQYLRGFPLLRKLTYKGLSEVGRGRPHEIVLQILDRVGHFDHFAKRRGGRTTLCANVSAALARLGKETITVDADLQQRNLGMAMGLENRIAFGLVDVVERRRGHRRMDVTHLHPTRGPEVAVSAPPF